MLQKIRIITNNYECLTNAQVMEKVPKITEEYRTTNQKVMPGRVTQSMANYWRVPPAFDMVMANGNVRTQQNPMKHDDMTK